MTRNFAHYKNMHKKISVLMSMKLEKSYNNSLENKVKEMIQIEFNLRF